MVSMVNIWRIAGGTFRTLSLATCIDAWINRSRASGSATSVPSDPQMNPTALPSTAGVLSSRRLTGTAAISDDFGRARTSFRCRRKAALQMARNTSLTEVSERFATPRRRAKSSCCVATRRAAVTRVFSADRGASNGRRTGSCPGLRKTISPIACAIERHCATSSEPEEETLAGALLRLDLRGICTCQGALHSPVFNVASARPRMRMPLTPSVRAWWTLV